MKIRNLCFALALFLAAVVDAFAQGTAFTYQGRLNDGASPANGTYDLQFTIYDAPSSGSAVAGPIVVDDMAVSNGLFTVSLDFGAGVFNGDARWLNLAVRPGASSGSFTNLAPRQPITSAPYAVRAGNASSVAAGNITGTIGLAQLPPVVITNGASGVNFTGSFFGNAGGLSNVQASSMVVNGALAWGKNSSGQSTVPVGAQSRVTAIAGGGDVTLALRDGAVLAWGRNNHGQANVPAAALSGVVAVAAGDDFCAALKSNGSVLAWGRNTDGQTNVPSAAQSGVMAIAAGSLHVLALKNDGSVLLWGLTTLGLTNVPPAAQSGVTAVSAGGVFSLALKSDGSVLAWGSNDYGETNVPPSAQSGVVAIAAGGRHNLALKTDGSVVAWGGNLYGQINVPTAAQSGVVAIAGGFYHSVALKTNGSVVAWGLNDYGQTDVPLFAQSGVGAIAAGWQHTVALATTAQFVQANRANTFFGDQTVVNGSFIGGSFIGSNVGIGTNNPQTKLDVVGDGRSIFVRPTAAGQSSFLEFGDVTGAFRGLIGVDGSGFSGAPTQFSIASWSSHPIGFFTAGAQRMVIDASGNVSIGSSNPNGNSLQINTNFHFASGYALQANKADYGANIQINRGAGQAGIGLVVDNSANGDANTSLLLVRNNVSGGPQSLLNVLANGNVAIGAVTPTNKLHVAGGVSATAYVTTSDRNAKENFALVSPQDVLNKVAALPITTWNFKDMKDGRHMGPMAQDFYAAFGLGGGDTTITSVDPDGVALAAIQGLNQKVESGKQKAETRMEKLEAENTALKERLERLERLLTEKHGGVK